MEPRPLDIARRVADRIVEETRFELVPNLQAGRQDGVYPLDFAELFPSGSGVAPTNSLRDGRGVEGTSGAVYYARAVLDVDSALKATDLEAIRLGVSHAPGTLSVRLGGVQVYQGADQDPMRAHALDYAVIDYERSVPLTLSAGSHPVIVRFEPQTRSSRVVIGFFDARTGVTTTRVTLRAPGLDPKKSRARFFIIGPLDRESPAPPLIFGTTFTPIGARADTNDDAVGQGQRLLRWQVPRRHVVAGIAEPLDYSDWRYFTGAILDALYEVSDTFEALDYRRYIERHMDFFLTHRDGVAREREALGLLDSAFGHYFRYQLLDDFGMQTVPFLEHLRRQPDERRLERSTLETTPKGKLVARALAQIRSGIPRLSDGTMVRRNPDPMTVWADDGFMGSVLLIRAAGYLDRPADIARGESVLMEDAVRQLLNIDRYLYDPHTGVYFHGYFARPARHSSSRWGRANGWTMLAKTELLRALAPQHPARARVLEAYQRHAAGLLRWQSDDGRWHQVLNRPDTYLETSASAMFVRALAEGLQAGWLSGDGYRDAVARGWAAISKQVRADGLVQGIVKGTPILYSDEAYDRMKIRLNDPRGLGAVLYAAASMERYDRFVSNGRGQ